MGAIMRVQQAIDGVLMAGEKPRCVFVSPELFDELLGYDVVELGPSPDFENLRHLMFRGIPCIADEAIRGDTVIALDGKRVQNMLRDDGDE